MRLKVVATVDFRYGVRHHYDEMRRKQRLDDLRGDEVALFVSFTGSQLAFVYRELEVERPGLDPVKAIAHYRIQLAKTTPWSPLMLSNYAIGAGIELVGIKRFEEHLKKIEDDEGTGDSGVRKMGQVMRALKAEAA